MGREKNLINKPNLALAAECMKIYEATTKIAYVTTMPVNKRQIIPWSNVKECQCTRCAKNHGKRKGDCYAYNRESRKCHSLEYFEKCCHTKLATCQNRNSSPHGIRKAGLYRSRKQNSHSPHWHRKQNIKKKNVNVTYKTEYDPELKEEDLYLNTVRKTEIKYFSIISEEIFAIIDCQDLYRKKHKMKIDTVVNRNILPHRIYRKMYPQNIDKNTDRLRSVTTEQTTVILFTAHAVGITL